MSYNGETKLFIKDNDVLPFSKGNLTFFSNPFIDIDDWGNKHFNLNNSFWSFEYLKSLYETRYVKFDCLSSEEEMQGLCAVVIDEKTVSRFLTNNFAGTTKVELMHFLNKNEVNYTI